MATTCKLIAKNVLGSDTATVTFGSIPTTFDDLALVVSARSASSANNWYVLVPTFNSDTTAANYAVRILYGFGSSTGSATSPVSVAYIPSDARTASTFGNAEIYIPNYAGSTAKSISATSVTEGNGTSYEILGAHAATWNGTAAISSIALALDTGNLKSGSSFYLFGITKA